MSQSRPYRVRTRPLSAVGTVLLAVCAVIVLGCGLLSVQHATTQREALASSQVQLAQSMLRAAVVEGIDFESEAFAAMLGSIADTRGIAAAGILRDHVVSHTSDAVLHGRVLSSLPLDTATVEIARGDETLTLWVTPAEVRETWQAWAFSPIGLMLGGGTILLVGVLSWFRKRDRELGTVVSAVHAFAAGERSKVGLQVHAGFGVTAMGWNSVVDAIAETLPQSIEATLEDDSQSSEFAGEFVLRALPWGIVVKDAAGESVYENNAAGHMLGLLRSEDGQGMDIPEISEIMQAICRGERKTPWTKAFEHDSMEQASIRVHVMPVEVSKGLQIVVLLEDITKQHLAEKARETFLAHATHELRTPLTNIRLYAEQASEDNELPASERNRALNVINQESRRLERLVGDMLSSAEVENGSMRLRVDDVRMDAFFSDLQQDYAAQAEQREIALSFDLPPKMPVIEADREKLSLAVHNLLGNALKYTARGGSVRVQFEHDSNGMARIEISDTGYGISEEDQERLFEPYFRSADERVTHVTGTGIGLGLARDVVRLHGGDLTLSSTLNEGSCFTLTLPARSVRAAA